MNTLRRSLVALGVMNPLLGCGKEHDQGKTMTEKIHDVTVSDGTGFTYPMGSLATVGEKINVLIRIKKAMAYTAALVFVERTDWPKEKHANLLKIYRGYATYHEPEALAYPIKLRFQLDSVDALTPVHVDLVESERHSEYLTRYPTHYPKLANGRSSVIWRANALWGIRNLESGVYRLRIENLNPAPEVDFETLLQFFHHYTKP